MKSRRAEIIRKSYFSFLLVMINRCIITITSHYATGGKSILSLFTFSGFKKAAFSNFARLDAGWYEKIAHTGYIDEKTTVFFPFYPMLMKAFSAVTGLSYKLSGQIISTI